MTSTGSMTAAIPSILLVLFSAALVKSDGVWDQWSDYSPCSRSCGGGVQSRTRGCLHMGSGQGNGCVGPGDEYMSCETEICPRGSEDFRSMQCSKFNQIPMILNGHSRRYEWVPHFDEKNRCALKCQASGTSIVRVLEEKVVDGTQCDSPEKFGVCVGGVCQEVGCDRLIGSEMLEDKCRVCGGDGSACRTEGGVFSQTNLNVGYHEFLTIPEGSTSINITKMKPSHSYLAMKSERGHFYINGGRDRTSQKAFGGTIFQYYNAVGTETTDTESIIARGPTNETLIVMLVSRGKNPGVTHEYSTPQALVEKAGDTTERFTWVYGRWTRCSQDCGTGYQLRAVSCMDRESGATVNDRSCNVRTRPRGNQTCNMGTCAEDRTNGYSWVLGHWDECSVVCGVGEQTQLAYCQEKGTMGQAIYVSDDICLRYLGEKPLYKRVCRGEAGCPHWSTGAWNECGVTCGLGYQTRRVFCHRLSETEESVKVSDSECKRADRPENRKPCQLAQCPGRRTDRVRELEGRNETVVPVKCSETQHGCCPDGVTRALDKQHSNCPAHTAGINECKLERSRGPCANYTLKWYYDDQTSLCNMFWYGGCGGNDNRFETEEECQYKCVSTDGTDGAPCSPGSQRCHNIAKCVPKARLCDGFNDCGDNSDEQNCATITDNQCGEGRSMCRGVKKCVSDRQKCDGYDDCGDNSDEENCGTDTGSTNQCGEGRSMCRGVKKCVSDRQRCDGYDDCGDNSDEENCEDKGGRGCTPGSTMCRSVRRCVPDTRRCDGYDDCGDNSDEENCGTTDNNVDNPCGRGRSMCRSVRKCVSDARRCDGIDDCGDGSDEEKCQTEIDNSLNNPCGRGRSMCRSVRKCVSDRQKCDGIDDCGDGSDEENCQTVIDNSLNNPCGRGRSMCRSVRKCVSDRQKCDGIDDCGDGSDEENCQTFIDNSLNNPCGQGRSMCRSVRKCVSDRQKCDGIDDCGDGSDEENCQTVIDNSLNNPCGQGRSMCRSVRKCVSDRQKCDGIDDCGDGSDEENCQTEIDRHQNPCGRGRSMCRSIRRCVSDNQRCNGQDDCGDNSDEENCFPGTTNQCGEGRSMCRGVKKCVSDRQRCDGYDDCGDNSDEENCDDKGGTTNQCGEGRSMCRGVKKCVSDRQRCDGYDDCGDNSDEENCGTDTGSTNQCGEGRSMCRGVKKCVSDRQRCDGYDDCGDNSDEENCGTDTGSTNQCGEGRSMCRGVKKCVSDRQRCDGYDDCGDNSDEENCGTDPGYWDNQCGEGASMCRSVKKCVADVRRCDGNDDCGDNSDEDGCDDDNISIECATSDHGCCPDGQTAATGPNQEGCPSIPATGCRTSRYGCCPDQVTSASGPNQQGCPQTGVFDTASCSLEKVKGDCGQWEAQWHFSTTTGACAQFWYGGCGGNANRFHNKTECETSCVHVKGAGLCRLPMSKGPCRASKPRYYFDFKTGECKKFNYGGCRGNSNRFRSKAECEMKCSDSTYIDSEDDDGPRCKTSRYGCCPDMKTPARGPNKYGCVRSCKTSRYGCCDDGVTAAEGPQQYGCEESSGMEPCEESRYGCCSDGVSRALGYNQEGCKDPDVILTTKTPIHTTNDPCAQEKDSTRCKDFVVKWFWDGTKQRCDRFWFGGCEGSMNKFDSEEDCLGRCRNSIERPDVNKCELQRETGPCRALLTRWYFDTYSQQCMTFTYGGCQGNENNFLSELECRQHCGGRVATPAPTPAPTQAPTQPPTTTTTVSWGNRPEKSSVEMTGEKYVKEGRPIRIQCEAATSTTSSSRIIEWFLNGNRMEESDRVQISTSLSGYTMNSELSIQRAEKADSGTYYCRSLPDGDVKMLYVTVADVSYIVTTVPPTYPPDFYTTARPRPTQPREVCMQEKAPGRCYASIPKWFYDHKDGVCREFIYGGCDGNENNFNTKEECDTFCRPEEICVLPQETGRCRALIPRWTYDGSSNMCVEFNYGGCGGNPNNFESKDSCERRCRTKHVDKPDKSGGHVCSLPRAGGTCDEYNILWYYDKDYKRCSRFIYTGCGGNGNRFQSEDECQAACEGGEVVVTTPAPTQPPRGKAVCDLRPDNARCDSNNDVADYKIKWYFDYERSVCARFYYGGCGGNANRFDTRQECQTSCVYGKKVVKTTPYPTTTTTTTTTTTAPLHCRYSTHGCCQDDETTAVDEYHSNCYDGPNVIERRKGEDYEILVRPGSDVLINCRIHRMEDDMVMWYRDRFAVKTGYRSTLYNNGSLLIKGMKPEDGGVYSCQVSGGNNVPQIERYNVQVQIPLRILNSPKIIKIKPGDNAFLHCQVYGQPTPTVTWMTRGRPVNSEGRLRAFENGTLIISSAMESDAGEYECHAENGVSHMVKKKVQLRIREPVRAKLDSYKGKVIEGGTVRLRCRGSGYPRPTMHWERDGEKLTNGDKISVSGRELVIRNAAIEDSGIYTCVVKNHHHEARAATVVQVDMQPMSETCEDSMSKMKCKMIRTARLCGHRTFSKRCCETCSSYRYR